MFKSAEILDLERRLEKATKTIDELRAQISSSENHISNERYALAIAGTGSGIWERNFVTGEVYRSERLLQILGYAPGDAVPDTEVIDAIIHPEDLERRRIAIQAHLDTRVPFDEEFRIRRKSGEYAWVHVKAQAVWNKSGKPLRWAGSLSDITKRKQAEKALQESEKHYRGLIENSGLGILLSKVTNEGQSTSRLFVNSALVRLLGYDSAEEIINNASYQLVAAHDKDKVIRYQNSAIAFPVGTSQQYQSDLVRKDGTIIPFDIIISKIMWNGEEVIQRTLIDLSERRHAEQAHRESEERYRNLVDVSPDGIVVQTSGRISFANAAMVKILGAETPDSVIGTIIDDYIPPRELALIKKRRKQLNDGERIGLREGTFIRVDGTEIPVERIVVRINWEGKPSMLILVRDISERKNIEQALRESQLKAEAASRAKSEFLATMSHEIRTPMHGVLATVSLLMGTELSPQQQNYADTIKQSGDALLSLLNSILDLSKIETGNLVLEESNFRLVPLLDEVSGLMKLRARHKGLAFEIECDPDIPEIFEGDPDRIRQILFNLSDNAVKFTETGGIDIRVSHTLFDDDRSEIRFDVSDTGIGLDDKQQQLIFERFAQADGVTTRKYGGTGLGLAICKELAELMGGSIGVRSSPGQGSEFWFTVRCKPGDAANISDKYQAHRSGDSVETKKISPLRILIAEDNPINQLIAADTLENAGHHVDVVSNGIEALEAVETYPYDLVLMDMFMPEMDGLTATRRIREMQGEVSKIPIIALTANAMVGEREKYLAAGLDNYVSKPFEADHLLETIERCIDGGK